MPEFTLDADNLGFFVFILFILSAVIVGIIINLLFVNRKKSTDLRRLKVFLYFVTAIISQIFLAYIVFDKSSFREGELILGFPIKMHASGFYSNYLYIGGIIANFLLIILIYFTSDRIISTLLKAFLKKPNGTKK